jgi:hypothetical protein
VIELAHMAGVEPVVVRVAVGPWIEGHVTAVPFEQTSTPDVYDWPATPTVTAGGTRAGLVLPTFDVGAGTIK